MSITLYGYTASRAARNLWVLEELNLPYVHEKVKTRDPSIRTPEYLAINPSGFIPSLKDGDAVMFESLGINLYLAEKYGKGTLWPNDKPSQAKCTQWTMWCATGLEPYAITMIVQKIFTPEEKRSQAVYDAAEEKLHGELALLEKILSKSPYLCGDSFSIGDLNIACVLSSLPRINFDVGAKYPTVKGWLDKCLARDAQQRVAAMPRT